jgi:hypothetical protein
MPSPSFLIDGDDDWGATALEALAARGDETDGWYALLDHASTATTAKPSKRWLAQARELLDDEQLHALAGTLLSALSTPPSGKIRRGAGIGALTGLDHLPAAVPTQDNATLLRGIIWICSVHPDEHVARLVAAAARECSKKLPDVGAR